MRPEQDLRSAVRTSRSVTPTASVPVLHETTQTVRGGADPRRRRLTRQNGRTQFRAADVARCLRWGRFVSGDTKPIWFVEYGEAWYEMRRRLGVARLHQKKHE